MKESLLIISGWAHGLEAIRPMGDAMANRFDVQLMTGAQVLKQQQIPDADVIVTGSMGGLLAMELLPESCQKLVLISSTAKFCATKHYPCGTPEKILKRMMLQLKRNPETVLTEFFKNVHSPHRQSRQIKRPAIDASQLDDLMAGLDYLLHSDVRERVPEMNIPVLLMHGTADQIIPPSAAEWLHQHLPHSELKIFEQDGHALPAHRFADVMNRINSFIASRITS